jgi:cell division protein FtsB
MFDFHEKRKIRSWMYSKITIGVLFGLALILGFSVIERFKVEREMAEKRHEQEESLAELKQRAVAIEAKVEHLENNRGVEEELRNRFDVAKEGERVVVIVGSEEAPEDLEALKTPPGSKESEGSFWDFFKFWD